MSPGATIGIDLSSREAFFASTAPLFTPDGPGRVLIHLTDQQIVDVGGLNVDIMRGGARLAIDGALFVIPTPAGIVAVKRLGRPPAIVELEREFRPGRHDRGWMRVKPVMQWLGYKLGQSGEKPDWRDKLAEQRRKAPTLTG